jgi:hypothetical protein
MAIALSLLETLIFIGRKYINLLFISSMIDIEKRIKSLSLLGSFLAGFTDNYIETEGEDSTEYLNELFKERVEDAILTSVHYNGWFTPPNVRNALSALAANLSEENLRKWLSAYPEIKNTVKNPKRIGVIMAGNIPLAGFHDFLSVLITGNIFFGKLSSQDKIFLPLIAEILIEIDPEFSSQIIFTEGKLKDIHAVIATGSNNSSRYFEYYFGKYPHIIRRNRNSVAVLSGKESQADLFNLGYDIFQYFGLGCRNVSKLFVPEDYEFENFFTSIYDHHHVADNHKYGNNYTYNKTVFLLNNDKLLDNGFLILKEDKKNYSPVGTLYYERYTDFKELEPGLRSGLFSDLQCVVTKIPTDLPTIDFGKTQQPKFSEYPDGIDTVKFLLELAD